MEAARSTESVACTAGIGYCSDASVVREAKLKDTHEMLEMYLPTSFSQGQV